MNSNNEYSNIKTARVAGLLYVILIISGVFAKLVVRLSLIVPGDAAATVNNIKANELLFRIGVVSDIILAISYLLLALVFYVLLKPVNKNYASLVVIFVLAAVPIMMLNTLNQFITPHH